MQNLVCVSKKMHLVFNDLYVTRRFLETCAKKYAKNTEECALDLKTKGALLFLRHYIYEYGLDKTYAITQQLHPRIFELCLKVERFFQLEAMTLCVQSCDTPHSFFLAQIQPPQGLVLYVNWQSVKIAHPFGVTVIHNLPWSQPRCYEATFSVALFLIDFLHADFRGFSYHKIHPSDRDVHPQRLKTHLYEVMPGKRCGELIHSKTRTIDFEQFSEKEVGHTLILSSDPLLHSYYVCQRAFEVILPQPKMVASPDQLSRHRLTKTLLRILED